MRDENKVYSFHRFPSRSEAYDILMDLLSSGVLHTDVEENLTDIAQCIEKEKMGMDIWGASYDNVRPLFGDARQLHSDPQVLNQLRATYGMYSRIGGIVVENGVMLEKVEDCAVTN